MPATNSFADYQIIRDGNITLDGGISSDPSEVTYKFNVPTNMVTGSSGVAYPILAFKIRPTETSGLTVFFDSVEVLDTSFDASHTRAYWEAINVNLALQQGPTIKDVRIVCTSGRIRLSDIIIWYQVRGQI